MKPVLAKLLPELQRATADAREALAGKHLNSSSVRDQIHTAALGGLSSWRVRMPDGLDLRDTPNAKLFMAWARSEGLQVEWVSRSGVTNDGRASIAYEPEISWDK